MATFVPILEAPGVQRVGRFGWKDQHASLLSFAGDAYLNEMGITNRLQPKEVTTVSNPPVTPSSQPDPNKVTEPNSLPDPADGNREDIDHFARFMRAMKVPPRDASKDSPIVMRGSALFQSIGCAKCHQATMVTLPAGTAINGGTFVVTSALGDKTIHPYSDFLLHNVGTGDGIPIAPVEHFGEPRAKQLMANDARLLNMAPQRMMDPLALGPSDKPAMGARATPSNARAFAAQAQCDAKARWREDKTPEGSQFYRSMQCTANRLRTPPLWGLHMRTRFMHDGQSTQLTDAIERHKVEAAGVVAKFKKLRAADKTALIAFLRSL
jgi:CxxC motif-containing protein (DUF1111 family)